METGYIPVIIEDLEGAQTPTVVYASTKIKLSDASLSRLGVWAVESPYIDNVGLISSQVNHRMLGLYLSSLHLVKPYSKIIKTKIYHLLINR